MTVNMRKAPSLEQQILGDKIVRLPEVRQTYLHDPSTILGKINARVELNAYPQSWRDRPSYPRPSTPLVRA